MKCVTLIYTIYNIFLMCDIYYTMIIYIEIYIPATLYMSVSVLIAEELYVMGPLLQIQGVSNGYTLA